MDLFQTDADRLLALPKIHVGSDKTYLLPKDGKTLEIELMSEDQSESFILNIWRGTIRLDKTTYGTRYKKIYILSRLDINGYHTNPDVEPPLDFLRPYVGRRFNAETHVHIYTEGFNDKWAVPLPHSILKEVSVPQDYLVQFMRYCNIIEPPTFQGTLV
ncbi:DUF6978 family protein [Vampirovibrio chlorellavorus]|uniref:DUF6978 family protein n=1 Tax=Vampirovibrio chlorellavorus TaxID=758823 RepID=UPI0026F33FDE|nr:hypothetical protein [Vampirovibrio chlorellavorus]